MKKVLKKVKEKDIDLYLIIFVLIIMANSKNILAAGDQLWNFANIYKMSIGYQIYQDLNVIITPLFFWIGEVLFKILGANYQTFAIYNIIIFQTLLILINTILKQLEIGKTRRTTLILLIFILFRILMSGGANYNTIALIPILYSVLLLLKNNQNYYLQGILIMITFMFKQNMGIYHGIGIVIVIITNHDNVKEKVKNMLKMIMVNAILLAIFLAYLYAKGILYDFFNFAICGINEFGRNNRYFNYNSSLYFYLSIMITAFLILVLNCKKVNFQEKNSHIKNNLRILASIRNTIDSKWITNHQPLS